MAKAKRPPWKRANPKKRAGKSSKHLSAAKKSSAKRRARAAGRRYPNLVDNMRASTSPSRKRKSKKKSKKKKKKARTSRREKDPRGGLTAAGRRAFARKQGAHLKPGVKKKTSEMTP